MDNSVVADLYQTKSNTDYGYGARYTHVESVGLDVTGQRGLVNNVDGRKK